MNLKSELRKLFSVRSTYVVSAMALMIVVLMVWVLVRDYKSVVQVDSTTDTASVSAPAEDVSSQAPTEELTAEEAAQRAEAEAGFEEYKSTRQREIIINSISTVASFALVIVILQIVHEYRWNTIMHTLTASRSRTKVFITKTGVLLGYALLLAALGALVGLITYHITLAIYDVTMPPQVVDWGQIALRGSLFMVTFVSFAAIIAYLSRNIALAIAGILIFPSTIEPLLGLLLKHNAIYLPFSANSQIILFNQHNPPDSLGFSQALITTLIYLAILYPLTWYLFLKRDAN